MVILFNALLCDPAYCRDSGEEMPVGHEPGYFMFYDVESATAPQVPGIAYADDLAATLESMWCGDDLTSWAEQSGDDWSPMVMVYLDDGGQGVRICPQC